MSLQTDVTECFRKHINDKNYDALKAFISIKEILLKARQGQEFNDPDSTVSNSDAIETGYFTAANLFWTQHMFQSVEDLLLEWWQDWSEKQRLTGKKVKRNLIAFWLANNYIIKGDNGNALRWLLVTQAEDVLCNGDGGAAKGFLTTSFGFPASKIAEFNRIGVECRAKTKGNWSLPEGFPEEIVSQFARTDDSFWTARATFASEFPLTKAYFEALLTKIDERILPKGSDGRAFEDLAFYLSMLLPGCLPRRNVLDQQWAGETDVLVHNLSEHADITVDFLGRSFIIECKDYSRKVDAQRVGYFLHRMRSTHVHFGIIFAKNDVTGRNEQAARGFIRRAFHQDGSLCIVIQKSDLEALLKSERPSFWLLLVKKIEEFRFGKPKRK